MCPGDARDRRLSGFERICHAGNQCNRFDLVECVFVQVLPGVFVGEKSETAMRVLLTAQPVAEIGDRPVFIPPGAVDPWRRPRSGLHQLAITPFIADEREHPPAAQLTV